MPSTVYGLVARVPPIGRLRAERDRLSGEVLDLRERLLRAGRDAREQTDRADSVAQEADELRREVDALRAQLRTRAEEGDARAGDEAAYRLFPPGHFYSPIPDLADVRQRATALFDRSGDVPGVDLRLAEQLDLLRELEPSIGRWPYGENGIRPAGLRYQPDNGFFGWTDSQLWYALLATRRPRRVIEVGSGWSTALLLDACDREGLDVRVTAVEPYPERLLSVLSQADHDRVTLVQRLAQDVPAAELADVGPGDVLFVDSTHVSKVGSDVNHLFFDVFPSLPSGVLVHVHDVAYPFEYPQEWVEEGRAWNEAYLLRALLTDNPRWRVLLWPSLLWLREPDRMRQALHPRTLVDGGSLWLQTV